ncbi:hypothetical protein [Quadrisphaera sp. DSM 44207]|uniref:hypothetical protein n=1 Tax=Quadrisphaera sp. DSM 44207 TaxID=1881057 RepID=UPI00088469FD|nr:hypothetical protein [Quadrisphaera sp. DSM 44207]SDQ86784.1 hypothetical protein SAMN05428996_2957 [Quadrisphaera sp. DSM 44207]
MSQPEGEQPAGPRPGEPVRRGRIRREPRYGRFVAVGVLAGLLAALVLTFSQPEGEYSYGTVLGYLCVVLGLGGGLLGALAAVLAARRR